MDKQDVFLIVCIYYYIASGGFKGGSRSFNPPLPPLPRSISQDMFSRLLNDMTLNRIISICAMKVIQNKIISFVLI